MKKDKRYMLVVRYMYTDRIVNMYFETKEEMEEKIKTFKNNVEIMHKLKIEEVQL